MMKLDAIFQRTLALPVVPQVVQKLLVGFNNEALRGDELACLIGQDQVLSAKLLRLANSAQYNRPQTIRTLHEAVQLLGWVNVRTLVISVGLMSCCPQTPMNWTKRFWRHNLRCAVAARHWAQVPTADSELAYLLGLLQGIGLLLLRLAEPQLMATLDAQASPFLPQRWACERLSLGYAYTDVSAELATRWQLPAVFAQVLALMAEPMGIPVSAKNPHDISMAALIQLSVWHAQATEQYPDTQQLQAAWPSAVAVQAGLPESAAGIEFAPWETMGPELSVLLD